MDRLLNLSSVAAYYRKVGKHGAFCSLERRFSNAAAARVDLKNGLNMVSALKGPLDDPSNDRGEFFGFAARAILGMGIIQYGRSTRLRQGQQGAVDVKPALSPSLHEDHDAIHSLRDDAIAHIGPGRRAGSAAWYQGSTHLRIKDDRGSISFQSNTSYFEQITYDRLLRLFPASLQIADDMAAQISAELNALVFEMCRASPSFFQKCSEHKVLDSDIEGSGFTVDQIMSYPAGQRIDHSFDFIRDRGKLE